MTERSKLLQKVLETWDHSEKGTGRSHFAATGDGDHVDF